MHVPVEQERVADPTAMNPELAHLYRTGRKVAHEVARERPLPVLRGRQLSETAARDIADAVVTAIYAEAFRIGSRRGCGCS